jgi:hypothetical protein
MVTDEPLSDFGPNAMFGHFIHQHDHRIADPNAGMHEPSIRTGQP